MIVVKLETQSQNCTNISACAKATQHEEVSKFLSNQYAICRSLDAQDTLYRNKQKHTTANMLLAEGKLCNVIRCLLNPCSKLADANEW